MEIASIILQIITLAALAFLISYFIQDKKNTIRDNSEKDVEKTSSEIPASANNNNEKREEFLRINAFFMKILCEKKSKSNFKKLQKEFLELGTRLYYLASERTIKKFLEFKSLSSFVEGTVHEHKIALLWFSEFNLLLREDLGLETSPALIKDYLNIILTYWDEDEMEKEELDDLKSQLADSIDNYFSVFNVGTSLN
ncbi:hypothetical protein L3049_18170 [Labilibaculum sp. DW002]|uniref:DUF4760 domain-containing protein n=1 Tax=Paralabilibaculum antarcticum TaxID=2912572 RepID=A0ABT5VWX0_9BACT|nr:MULTISPECIES: hypothetical protein [unclassified Labilibaculum]MBI9056630.1 hypothetical protein [Labilibaculum sp.]MDE5419920.1 hypothetical protein [Labilibaculum sp. DW002]